MQTETNTIAASSSALDIFLRLREVHNRELSAIATLEVCTSDERSLLPEDFFPRGLATTRRFDAQAIYFLAEGRWREFS